MAAQSIFAKSASVKIVSPSVKENGKMGGGRATPRHTSMHSKGDPRQKETSSFGWAG
jgi:hypothetical protein